MTSPPKKPDERRGGWGAAGTFRPFSKTAMRDWWLDDTLILQQNGEVD